MIYLNDMSTNRVHLTVHYLLFGEENRMSLEISQGADLFVIEQVLFYSMKGRADAKTSEGAFIDLGNRI